MKFEDFVMTTHDILDSYKYLKLSLEQGESEYKVIADFDSIDSFCLNVPKTWSSEEYKTYLENYLNYVDR